MDLDQNNTDLEIVTEPSLARQVGETVLLSVAASAGTAVGFLALGWAVTKIETIREKRAAKKNQTSTVDDE